MTPSIFSPFVSFMGHPRPDPARPEGGADGGPAPGAAPRRAAMLVAFLALLAWSFIFTGSRGIWEPDEGRYTAIALEMLRSGDFLIPAVHPEQPHVAKPPVTYWAIAGSIALFGHNEWAARLPNALAFALTGLLLFHLGRRVVPAQPWMPTLVYSVSLLPFVGAAFITSDTLLGLGETAGMACYVAALHESRPRRRTWWIAGLWLAFAFAFLIKGPPALLPLVAIVVLHVASPRCHDLPRLLSPVGFLCFAAPIAAWSVAIEHRLPGLLGHLLHYEVFGRVATSIHDRNASGWDAFRVYVPTLLLGVLPWTVAGLGALRAAPRWLHVSTWRLAATRDSSAVLLAAWFCGPLAVFLAVRSRLPLYVLPLFVPLSLMLARSLASRQILASRRWRAALAVWMTLLVGIKATAGHVAARDDTRDYARYLASIAKAPVAEVVFVDMRPRYGLSLYLGVQVESLALQPNTPRADGFGVKETVAEELASNEAHRLFVLPNQLGRAFHVECERAGAIVTCVGMRGEDSIYAELPHARAVRQSPPSEQVKPAS